MPDANLNAWWCRHLAEELRAAGCVHVVGCPGSRNSPLLFALAAVFGDRLTMHWDERGAAFFALGLAKAARAPVAVCVTSGTAAANLLPAACEADAAGVPLLLLTADRPARLQDCGAPQTMPQRGLFGVFAEALAPVEPVADAAALDRLCCALHQAVRAARRPVHLNLPFDDPLPPIPERGAAALPERGAPAPPGPRGSCPARSRLPVLSLPPAAHGLIIAGPAETIAPSLVARLAEATGFPVLADALSGLRRPAIPGLVACPDALYAAPPVEPDVIIRIGPPPLTRAGYEWLAARRCPQIVLGGPRDDDFIRSATARLVDPDDAAIGDLIAALGRSPPGWAERWRTCLPAPSGWNATAATALACAHAGFPLLWLGSSMPVRDANLTLAPRAAPQRILCHRGLSGIDGNIAGFLGACRATAGPGLALLGDLAALHDLNSLALAGAARGALVVLNNGGGAIFDALPVAQVPGYRRLVRADHDLDFTAAAAQFRLGYRRCADAASLAAALDEASAAAAMLLVECVLADSDGVATHRAALREALGLRVRPAVSGPGSQAAVR